MENYIQNNKSFDATLTLDAVHINSINKVLWRNPLITYKIILAIYWQAFKLWIKGVPFHSHPNSIKRT